MAVYQQSNLYDWEEALKQIKPCTRLFRSYSADNYFRPVDPFRSDTKELYEPQPYYK